MLVLASLNKLLASVLNPPALHTAVLFTTSGALVSFAAVAPGAVAAPSTCAAGERPHPATNGNGAGASHDMAAIIATQSGAARPKDDVRVLVGLATEVWAETREDREGLVDSELGRVVVCPIGPSPSPPSSREDSAGEKDRERTAPAKDPVLLLALNGTEEVDWAELQLKAQTLASHLSRPLQQLHDKIVAVPASSSSRGSRR